MSQTIYTQVDQYLSSLFSLEDEVLRSTEQSIRDNGMPEHSVSANQGQFLYLLARLCGAKRIIEIGALGGYSTIWLGRALPAGGSLTSIEIDPDCAAVARQNMDRAGLSDRVEVLTGDGLRVLRNLEGRADKVDLFFMDADKPNYVNYFNWALRNARPGSLIVADNVIRDGKILDTKSRDEKVIGVQHYLRMLAENDQVISSVLQQVGEKDYDGIAISLVK